MMTRGANHSEKQRFSSFRLLVDLIPVGECSFSRFSSCGDLAVTRCEVATMQIGSGVASHVAPIAAQHELLALDTMCVFMVRKYF
jgi:hypothetical protein